MTLSSAVGPALPTRLLSQPLAKIRSISVPRSRFGAAALSSSLVAMVVLMVALAVRARRSDRASIDGAPTQVPNKSGSGQKESAASQAAAKFWAEYGQSIGFFKTDKYRLTNDGLTVSVKISAAEKKVTSSELNYSVPDAEMTELQSRAKAAFEAAWQRGVDAFNSRKDTLA